MPTLGRAVFGALIGLGSAAASAAELPEALSVEGAKVVMTLHAEGIQVYECRRDDSIDNDDARLPGIWKNREDIDLLIDAGRTVGRHFGTTIWQHNDGSLVQAVPVASFPGASPNDVPWQKFQVAWTMKNYFSGVTHVLRINTKGGQLDGPCLTTDGLRFVQFSADYIFLRK